MTTKKKKPVLQAPPRLKQLTIDQTICISGESRDILWRLWRHRYDQALSAMDKDEKTRPRPRFAVYNGVSITRFPYFKEAEESAMSAIKKVLQRDPINEWRDALQWVFDMFDCGVEVPNCVARLSALLGDAVYDGNFFSELRKGFPKGAPRSRLKLSQLTLHLLAYWTERLLWLAPDHAGSLYLQRVVGLADLTEAAYTKERQRLGLFPFPGSRKPISGLSLKSGFVFSAGDLDKFLKSLSS